MPKTGETEIAGSALVLSAVRIWAQALRDYKCPVWGLHHLFRAHGLVDGMRPFHVFLVNMCANAGRRLHLHDVTCPNISADEDSILTAVTHFQQGNEAEAERSLLAVVAPHALPRTAAALSSFSAHMTSAGLPVLHVSRKEAVTVH